ncbi:MAG: LLM class flavin-dependent oxidoreductase [Anaerolineae bacterium]|nr:LLM class flavin-dependent oxidoreductase [Anaerolineae bacterium]
MPIEFGVALYPGPEKGRHPSSFVSDLDILLPKLQPHFTSIWMTDHFFWGDNPTFEAWTVMAYLASHFPEYMIGPMVLGQSYRNPALLAKMAATLQDLSNGRFVMGIGAGWKEDEYLAYGYPYPSAGVRIDQLEDTIEIMLRMWKTAGKVTYHGKHYHIVDAYCEPKPDPIPSLIVGGGGERTMMLAARFADGWNLPDAPIHRYTERLNVLRQHCQTVGRDFNSIRKSWFGRIAVASTEQEAAALSNGRWTHNNAICGDVASVISQIRAFVELGVDQFMVEIQGQSRDDIIDLLAHEVLPEFSA